MYHHIDEPFEIDGKTYVAKEDNSRKSCFYCAFRHKPEVCAKRKCEPRTRTDGLQVRFDEVKA